MAKKIKDFALTLLEVKELGRKREDVWVVYEYGFMQQCPASIFGESRREDRMFFKNYWHAWAFSEQRKAKYKS